MKPGIAVSRSTSGLNGGCKISSVVKPPLQLALLAQANGNLYRLLQPVWAVAYQSPVASAHLKRHFVLLLGSEFLFCTLLRGGIIRLICSSPELSPSLLIWCGC